MGILGGEHGPHEDKKKNGHEDKKEKT